MLAGIGGNIGDQAQGWLRRQDIGSARQVFLDDVVLNGALQFRNIRALFLGHGDIKRQKPGGCGVDCHRGVHLFQRNIGEQGPHVAQMRHGDADLANLACRAGVIAVIAGLGGQIEGHGQARLTLGKVPAIQRVRSRGCGMAGIGAEKPGIFAGPGFAGHGSPLSRAGNFVSSRRR